MASKRSPVRERDREEFQESSRVDVISTHRGDVNCQRVPRVRGQAGVTPERTIYFMNAGRDADRRPDLEA